MTPVEAGWTFGLAGGALILGGVVLGAAWQRARDRRFWARWWAGTRPGPASTVPPTALAVQEVVASAVKPPRSRAPIRYAVEDIRAGDRVEERLKGALIEVRPARAGGWSQMGIADQPARAGDPLEIFTKRGSITLWVRPFGATPPDWVGPERGTRDSGPFWMPV